MKKILALCAFSSFIFANNIVVNDPYVRQTPPNAKSTAFFLELTNKSNNDIALIKAESSLSDTTEIHDHVMDNGKKMMMQIPQITIKANSSTTLKPGGKHIMALNLNQNITEDTKADLTLYFDDNSTIVIKDIHSKNIMK
ncbi:copper chaperone PCu(A)C [Campylobacter insulaenigrae]|uniref:Copper chaperone PCu(A)C n=1 Tax=Campylobacter insulaenigrae TaxID=260714 RepID=A0ABY3G4P1_9BACT|nr:copper chaperone PCu(A)C [Campylobacter insulaenigrae]MCR6570778.1 copper chaperone PCu(A)C [Campylobacter insulaenigrae]MCR6572717.1 copper chaperone PCu(A)C [Campylobacter insulaenigrae]MCR6573537.1 copper chaperone PCu(A)C [Campylobacter insulaenigrae]MCR6575645.1 copper chaperone PCu(A)C [Campylobacter insulaenigrae]MCR6577078.1 copper chaperone PCu(A)C [Campylobacter insulaenigrae]